MTISTYQANQILNLSFGNTGYTPPSTLYLGFYTSGSITADWSGYTLMANEPRPVGADPETNYHRIPITNDKNNWTVSTDNSLSNINHILTPKASVNWGTIYGFFIADAYTNGNMLSYQAFSVPLNVLAGESIVFYPGDLVVEMG